MSRKSTVTAAVLLLTLVIIVVWGIFFKNLNYYIVAAAILLLSVLPFFIRFEKRASTAREITLTAALTALAVVSRAVFYLIPQVKPVGAVVIAAAVCLGAERGYVIGAFTAFMSNFIFGQGYWTPFQMAALGAVGFIAGAVFSRVNDNPDGISRIRLSVVGFLLTFAVYGLIVDLSTVFVALGNRITLSGALGIYLSGAPFSLVFGISTAVFLYLFGLPFIRKIRRITVKYNAV